MSTTEREGALGFSPTRRMAESALMVAIGTVLSMFPFSGLWALGGGVTLGSMVPLVVISFRYGCKWGTFTAFVYSVLQMILGFSNVQYATSALMAAGIIMLDYVAAFSVAGLSAMFRGKGAPVEAAPPADGEKGNELQKAVIAGVLAAMVLRFICHFLSGWIIWEALWPNEFGMAPAAWSVYYNASYMIPETIITVVISVIVVPLVEKIKK